MGAKKTGLGKGLDALFSTPVIENNNEEVVKKLKINEIEPNKQQARKIFDDESIERFVKFNKRIWGYSTNNSK